MASPSVSDEVARRALEAYEALPRGSGRLERMRAAIAAVTKPRVSLKSEES
jgi:hypothetical protein